MGREFRTQRRVEFRDTDAAGIAHFSALMVYLEQAEHDFWRSIGTTVMIPDDAEHLPVDERVRWPRVHVEADFQGPVRFEDTLDIDVRVLRLGSKSVTYGFVMTCRGAPVCTGSTTAACCLERDGKLQGVPIPPSIRDQLNQFLVEA
jgi:acyl-CoA thioester hydrolase